MLEDRSIQILKAAIKEFIETGEPVSSEYLFKQYDFGIKPAMIRHELNFLAEQGYLEQPHHAAGRIPTDKGYEFLAREFLRNEDCSVPEKYLSLFEDQDWDNFLERVSRDLGVLGVINTFPGEEFHKGFLENLIDGLEWNTHQEIKEIIKDFDEIDEKIKKLSNVFKEEGDSVKVFVGNKSPITKSDYLTVFTADFDVGSGKMFFCAIGPKRMDYEKPAKLLKGLKTATKKENGRRKNQG